MAGLYALVKPIPVVSFETAITPAAPEFCGTSARLATAAVVTTEAVTPRLC